MAVKNGLKKKYKADAELVMRALRDDRFSNLIQANFTEEAKKPDGIVEFRYVRKTTASRYGRNYFITVTKLEDETTEVLATVQSRKITVLIDPNWKSEAEKLLSSLEVLMELAASKADTPPAQDEA